MASDESAVLFDQPGPKTRKTIRIVNWIAGIVFAIVVVLILMRLHNPPDGENQLSWELWKPALDAEAWTDFYLRIVGHDSSFRVGSDRRSAVRSDFRYRPSAAEYRDSCDFRRHR